MRSFSLKRRRLACAAAFATLATVTLPALAQNFPSRPIKLIVGYASGGGVDNVARLIGQALSTEMGTPIVVENRPGAGGQIGAQAVVRAPRRIHPADGQPRPGKRGAIAVPRFAL